jgi:transcriptional regulator with XRE-family HTH domain/Zn-dependent peptidase ImmA (M78 family)
MFGRRLQQLRLARNLSLEALAAQMGGIVTKQALSKYEHGRAKPSPVVLGKMAAVLGVKASYLFVEPSIRVEFIAYRKSAHLLETERKVLKSRIEQALENRVKILELLGHTKEANIPIKKIPVKQIEDAEVAAEKIRRLWNLGLSPICNMTETMEENSISVIDIDANEDFDGISACVYDAENKMRTVAVVTRNEIAGERQRLNLSHELGHLVIEVGEGVDEEKAAFRFGAALLAPANKIFEDVGKKRAFIQLQELFILKKQFGLSIQALVHRLYDLNIITESEYGNWFTKINKYGWKKKEPEEMPFEESNWLRRNVLRFISEGRIGQLEAEKILGEKLELEQPASIIERRAFMKLPVEKRRQILAEQAAKMTKHDDHDSEWRDFEGGEVIEY